MKQRPFLSVVLPAFNEAELIENTLRRVVSYLAKKSFEANVLVVDDGSTDGTARIVRDLMATHDDLRLETLSRNHGKGYAVRHGLRKATGSVRLFMDADCSTAIEEFDRMVPEFQDGADVVIGSRRRPESRIASHQPLWREVGGIIFNRLIRWVNGIDYRDTQVGFKAFSAEVVEPVVSEQVIDGWAFDVELLVIAQALEYDVRVIPVEWTDRGYSQVGVFGMAQAVLDLFRVKARTLLGFYPGD